MEDRPIIKAETFHVDELVSRALRGRIRIPRFQRGLKWRDTDVQKLFDSINRGFPIGTFLMWKRPAKAELVSFGPVEVEGQSTDDAWWVVDGQQRLTSLVAGLRNPDHSDPDDPFVVYYDMKPDEGQAHFFRPHRLRKLTPYSIPLNRCFDAADFQEWLFDFVQATSERELIEHASGVATRIRNYRVPVYVVETDDAEVARQIFLRTNRAGRRMDAHEVFSALAPSDAGADRRPVAVAERLTAAFGNIEPNLVAKAAKSLVSDDVTGRDLGVQVSNHESWMEDTEAALENALRFINDCRVTHTRLLPAVSTPLVTLARFFAKHPEPNTRNRRLLRRWLWRGFFGDSLASDAKTLRRAVVAVSDDEDASVQALLTQVPKSANYRLPADFDARNGSARLAALVMAVNNPIAPMKYHDSLESEEVNQGDVFEWLQEHGSQTFSVFPGAKNCPGSRFITPGVPSGRLKAQLRRWAETDLEHDALQSHLISPAAARALLDSKVDDFVRQRTESLQQAADELFLAMAEPKQNDRPTLRRLAPE